MGVLLATFTGRDNMLPLGLVLAAAGFFAPDLFLIRAISPRKKAIALNLPDAMDLLVMCMEAGLGMDQAMLRVAKEMRHSAPELCDELLIISREQRAGRPRVDAWRGMADRVDLDIVRQFSSMLTQSERLGTPIATSLGQFADTSAHQTVTGSRGARRQDHHQAGFSACPVYFSGDVRGDSRTCGHRDCTTHSTTLHVNSNWRAVYMDNVLMIRMIAGILAVILLTIIIARRKRMASLKHPPTRTNEMAMQTVRVSNTTRSTVLGERIGVADTSWSRMVGLLGKTGLELRRRPAHHSLAGRAHCRHALPDRRCFSWIATAVSSMCTPGCRHFA